ncbi:MAG TPA: D-2-hydroxyacid dehydrogenase [Ktedonobacteraceae bacterium]
MNDQPIHVLSVLNLSDKHLQRIEAVAPRLVVSQRVLSTNQAYRASAQEFAAVLTPEIEVLYAHTTPFDLDLVPNLRWVQLNSAGVDLLYDTPLWQSEIAITSASGIHAVQIAEYVLGMLLSYAHHFPEIARLQSSGRWPAMAEKLPFATRELRGKTLGILGYGAIGREVARLASTFGMRILATRRAGRVAAFDGWTPSGTGDPAGSLPERFYDLNELSALLPECDMLVLALPLSSQTHHLIGQAELALMRPHAFLVNIGRGPLIDHDALAVALSTHAIGGAALDVTEPEPLPVSSPLWALDTAIITPHVSGMSVYYNDRVVELFCANLQRYLAGEPLYNLVQRDQGY